jgi:hypothetical protein
MVTQPRWVFEVQKNVSDILEEDGVRVSEGDVEVIIWSH